MYDLSRNGDLRQSSLYMTILHISFNDNMVMTHRSLLKGRIQPSGGHTSHYIGIGVPGPSITSNYLLGFDYVDYPNFTESAEKGAICMLQDFGPAAALTSLGE